LDLKPILVTGGAGFIGSHLCERLIDEGEHVLCLDNLMTGHRDNISKWFGHKQFEMFVEDVVAPLHFDVTGVYHLACPASPIHYQRDPVRTVRTCVMGAINVLDLALSQGCPVLHASTSEVYGDPQVHPQPESYVGSVNPIGPRACYDEGKRCAETLMFDYRRQYNVEVRVARIFNTYGPRMRQNDGRVISNFIIQALRGKDITIYGDGTQTRSFCYVDDMVTGLVRLMQSGVAGPVNLGNPQEIPIRMLAGLILAMTGSKSRIVHLPAPDDDPARRRPDIGRARDALDWRPTVALEDGLTRTIEYFDAEISQGRVAA
jgi:UDP-glucuronate decarboxylase